MLNLQNTIALLERHDCPGFTTRGNTIVYGNSHAQAIGVGEGGDIAPLLGDFWPQVQQMGDGALFVTLEVHGNPVQAEISRTDEGYLFILEIPGDDLCLRSLALASAQLRNPLSSILVSLEALLSGHECNDPILQEMCRGYYQMQRILDNMSDGYMLHTEPMLWKESVELGNTLEEIFEAAATAAESTGHTITFHAPMRKTIALVDREQLETCILRLLSNSLKFLPPNGRIHGELLSNKTHAIVRITDNGTGIPQEILSSLFTRFHRVPGLEDIRHGLGLGLTNIRGFAAAHGGAVYVAPVAGGGTEVSVSIALRKKFQHEVNSPIPKPMPTGVLEKTRLELSEVLPGSFYDHL
ncbi:MAG: HAMP domain-containing histidine kinase [Ruminococcaceae bacterium]|nr:HAMP domain-containing histidine kinase [Oscillospiraceae bacterium]